MSENPIRKLRELIRASGYDEGVPEQWDAAEASCEQPAVSEALASRISELFPAVFSPWGEIVAASSSDPIARRFIAARFAPCGHVAYATDHDREASIHQTEARCPVCAGGQPKTLDERLEADSVCPHGVSVMRCGECAWPTIAQPSGQVEVDVDGLGPRRLDGRDLEPGD